MADRWEGARSRSKSPVRGRSPDRDQRRRPRSPAERRRSRSPRRRSGSRERRRDERRRSGSRERRRSRSRSRGRQERVHPARSPPRRHYDRSPPGRNDRSPAGRDYRRRSPPPARDFRGGPPPSFGRPPASDAPPEPGSIHHATVVSVRPFGAFVELPGFRKQGLIHNSQVSEELRFGRDDDDDMKVKAMEFFLPRGEKVWVKVLNVQQDGRDARVSCSMRAVDQEDGADLDPDNLLATGGRGGGGGPGGGGPLRDEAPELYSIHKAAVQSVRPFGVFVQIEGYRKYGLVHFTQISDHLHFGSEDTDQDRIQGIGEVLSVGDPVMVKVVEVSQDERGPRVGCSIKLVSQADGGDLDPSNTKYRPRGEGGAGPRVQQPIGAHVAEAQNGAVDWGYLKADVVQYGKGSRQYDLVGGSGDEAGGPSRRGGSGGPPPPARGGPPPPGSGANMAPMPSRGRGSGAVLPAWMTGGGGGSAAPGAPPPAAAAPGGGGGAGITSVEQALAIIEEHTKARKEKRHKKDKKKKKHKHKQEKSSKHKKEQRRSRGGSSGSSSGSESD